MDDDAPAFAEPGDLVELEPLFELTPEAMAYLAGSDSSSPSAA